MRDDDCRKARLTAVALCQRTPFVDQALQQRQKAVHLVLFGATKVAIEIVLQVLRLSPALGLGRPRLDWFCDAPERLVSDLSRRNGALGALAETALRERPESQAPLGWALELHVHPMMAEGACGENRTADPAWMQGPGVTGDGALTAIVVAVGEDLENIALAMSLRDLRRETGFLGAPVFVHRRATTPLDSQLRSFPGALAGPMPADLPAIGTAADRAETLEPFGALATLDRLVSPDGSRETMARRIHAAYLETRRRDGTFAAQSGDRDPSLRPWPDLSETYRQANRRAADHLAVKLVSVAAARGTERTASLSADILADAGLFEDLAAIEHAAWRIDRELDGWRLGPRDKDRKTHPDLLPYSQLSEEIKHYDREQIRLLTRL